MRFPVTVERTERLTLMVEADTQEGAYAEVSAFIASSPKKLAFAYLLGEEWADEHKHAGVKIETDPLRFVPKEG